MFTLMTLLALCFLAMCAVGLLLFVSIALKCAFKLVLLPFKLLFLPILAVVFIVKFAVLLAIVGVVIAVLIPIAILLVIFVGPFLLISALT